MIAPNPPAPDIRTDLNVIDSLQHLNVDQLIAEQKNRTLPYAVAAINLNGDLNIGMIIRSAVIFGARKMYIFGRGRYDKRTTVGAHNYIETEVIESFFEDEGMRGERFREVVTKDGYTPVYFEQDNDGLSLNSLRAITYQPCLTFGNEGFGLSPEFMGEDAHIISIHQVGIMRSLNVSATAAIACHKMADIL
jgi:tRNA G18 (ribose-2'-O)-methylase SpoU